MIYVVKKENWYVAAILKGTEALTQFLLKVPTELREQLTVEKTKFDQYPFKIAETRFMGRILDFEVWSGEETDNHIQRYTGTTGAELLAIYTIDKDFLGDPDRPGADYMGKLNHEHFGDDDE